MSSTWFEMNPPILPRSPTPKFLIFCDKHISNYNSLILGDVHLVLNGQSCKNSTCNKSIFIKPVFSFDAIQRILEKLMLKVKQKFYEVEDMENLDQRYGVLNAFTKQGRGTHIPELCEGCKKGRCQSKATVHHRTTTRRVHNYSFGGVTPDIYVTWHLRM